MPSTYRRRRCARASREPPSHAAGPFRLQTCELSPHGRERLQRGLAVGLQGTEGLCESRRTQLGEHRTSVRVARPDVAHLLSMI